MANPYVLGLTGNIATGKSTVGAMLARMGAEVIDADRLAHRAMEAGTHVHQRIVDRFGPAVLDEKGEIDRSELAEIVFADPIALRDLEQIVHPAVVQAASKLVLECDRPVCVIEAIKLLEARMHEQCNAVWVVTCSRAQQVERLMRTRNLSQAEAELRVDAQPPPAAKTACADIVIDNSGGFEHLSNQVRLAWMSIPGAAPSATPLRRKAPSDGGTAPCAN